MTRIMWQFNVLLNLIYVDAKKMKLTNTHSPFSNRIELNVTGIPQYSQWLFSCFYLKASTFDEIAVASKIGYRCLGLSVFSGY
jgi:hypothetical protein